jgi:hypothetical protein
MLDLMKRRGVSLAVSFVVGTMATVGGYFAVHWLVKEPPAGQFVVKSTSIEGAWNDAIKNFGIEPVFPPEEDLSVGDVLAVIVSDKDPDSSKVDKIVDAHSPFLKRSVKLAHVDVRQQLEEAYGKLPAFPNFEAKMGDKNNSDRGAKSSAYSSRVNRQFTREVLESNLPRAAFTSLKIQGINSAAFGLVVNTQASGYGASSQGMEELHLVGVSTYGLPSARALGLLKTYCSDEKTRDDCRETTVRRHLRQIVGDRIHSKYVDPQGKEYHPIEVEIVIVNRVYLARSIVHLRRAGSAQGGTAHIMAPSSQGDSNTTDKEPPKQAGSTSQGTSGDATSYDALKKRVEEVEKQLSRARAGGTLAYASSRDSESALNESLDRPVAFGYRSVRYEFTNDEKR